tara:strand:+ start:173 stop:1099 length:927 start_codon:yes stop_codon:yes gene_type:complete
MANTHDYSIANDTGSAVRTDLNTLFTEVEATNAGATAPSNLATGKLWYDTANSLLKQYDGSAWVVVQSGATPDIGTPSAGVVTNLSGVLPVGVTGGSGLTALGTVATGVLEDAVTYRSINQDLGTGDSPTFAGVNGTDLELIGSTTLGSAATTISKTDCFSTSYDTYLISANIGQNTNSTDVRLRMSTSGTDNTASVYWQVLDGYTSSSSEYRIAGASQSFTYLNPNMSNSADHNLTLNIWVYNARSTSSSTRFHGTISYLHGGGYFVVGDWGAGFSTASTVFNGITIYPSSGQITAGSIITAYGVKQ